MPVGRQGFTLIELMVVIAVVAVLATIALFGLNGARGAARNTQRQQVMNSIRAALERYNGDVGAYPVGVNFSDLITNLTTKGYFTGVPLDPGCGGGNVTMTAAAVAGSNTFSGGNWYPCSGGAANMNKSVGYSYAGVLNGGYTLVLWKEGGGSTSFKSHY